MPATRSEQLREDLESERDELQKSLSELTTDGADAPDFDENFADSAQVAAEQGENLALAAALPARLPMISKRTSNQTLLPPLYEAICSPACLIFLLIGCFLFPYPDFT